MSDTNFRRVLWVAALFNLSAALAFALPESVGQLFGLPVPVQALYSTLLALFIVLFGGCYAWLARQPVIHRPLVGFCAIGKAGVFVAAVVLWLAGEVSALTLGAAAGDGVFAALFLAWLRRPAQG